MQERLDTTMMVWLGAFELQLPVAVKYRLENTQDSAYAHVGP